LIPSKPIPGQVQAAIHLLECIETVSPFLDIDRAIERGIYKQFIIDKMMVRARTSMCKEYVKRGSIVCLIVEAWNDGQATLVCLVGGTIRLLMAATNAIDALIWFNELNEVPESKATGSTREFGTGHSTFIRGRERERSRVKCTCHLRIGQICRFKVVGRFQKARRQFLGMADLSSGTGAVRNGLFQAVGDVSDVRA